MSPQNRAVHIPVYDQISMYNRFHTSSDEMTFFFIESRHIQINYSKILRLWPLK